MARIRTIKPEAFFSESLAGVSLTAERTFFGLVTQADDQGRFRDHPAIIAGVLWPLRPEHTAVDVEADLGALAEAGLICRYTGCDGRGYLHIVTWHLHQKIDRPSKSRTPACPIHQPKATCGGCGAATCQHPSRPGTSFVEPARGLDEPSTSVPRVLNEGSSRTRRGVDEAGPHHGDVRDARGDCAGQERVDESSTNARGALVEDSSSPREGVASGSRTVDLGSTAKAGRAAPADRAAAQMLIAEYVAGCAHRPPKQVVGHLARQVGALLDEGVDPGAVRAGLERFRQRPMHPSVLPSLVNEALNPPADGGGLGRPRSVSTVPRHVAWTNPVDPAAYEGEL
ncbi:hypothetical protein [Streptomyces triticirhizae]|uniref:Phage or prophage related protein n=1 Tax=Streptomyces triticirhizae TaxID=2483353 RepID=A0A3M2MDK2_9ACTN|nr:hypothetical protein [Streptomyces triticirhizae]RMI46725.1 hypothetical protein EBN88_00375 [Streptomyces triticirhizae]